MNSKEFVESGKTIMTRKAFQFNAPVQNIIIVLLIKNITFFL